MPTFIRLTDYKSSDEKEQGFFELDNRYEAKQDDFEKIPGSPIAYWVNSKTIEIFDSSMKIIDDFFPSTGLQTGDNIRYIRKWFEVSLNDSNISIGQKWFKLNNGGEFRKWYGNFIDLLLWENDGQEIKKHKSSVIRNEDKYFKRGITWNRIATDGLNMRSLPANFIFDQSGDSLFFKESNHDLENYLLSFFNTKIAYNIMKIIAPTLNLTAGGISDFPMVLSKSKDMNNVINILSRENIDISKEEWGSRETSWDFIKNELLKHKQDGQLENALNAYASYWTERFNTLHSNEEELNRLFIDIYGLQDELTPDVVLEDITILKSEAKVTNGKLVFDNKEIIKQFISYAVGCMFGRYTLDNDGLVVANQNQAIPTDTTFEIDDDNIIPIVDESDYFSDDMTDRFTEFVRATFGSEKLQQNIAFIEASLGKKLRAYFMKDFYVDHTKRYKKRPIYWLFSSPNATFQVLIYMHRYTLDTLNHILNDYLRPFRIRLDTMRNDCLRITESEEVSARDKTEADKKIDKIDKTLDDITEYEKVLDHYAKQRIEIDLDDGVKINYCKFKDLLFEFDKKLCK